MLVLGRKQNESITIGDDIRILVVDIQKNKVRLGIEAPVDLAVHRPDTVDKKPGQSRVTLLQYVADLRRRFVAVQSCLDAFDAGTPADEVLAGIREVTYAASH